MMLGQLLIDPDQQLVDSQPIVNWLICVNQNLVDSWQTVDQDVMECWLSTKVCSECSVNNKGWSRVLIKVIDRHSTIDVLVNMIQ